MPIYEFSCNDCGRTFEKFVRKQGQEIVCPGCSGGKVRRMISACNFGSSDGSVQPASQSSCSSCTASSCSSCSGGGH